LAILTGSKIELQKAAEENERRQTVEDSHILATDTTSAGVDVTENSVRKYQLYNAIFIH